MESAGELLTARMRADQQMEHLRALNQQVARWQKNWRKTRVAVHRLRQQCQSKGEQSFLCEQGGSSDLDSLFEFLAQNDQQLKSLAAGLNALVNRVANDQNHLQLVTEDVQDGIRRVRLRPVATLFDQFPRLVRDLSREQGKEIELRCEGGDTEVDRQVLDLLKDPLTHLLRNAVDHGIEPPARREAVGKPRSGTICLRAEQRGKEILIEVVDDGAGIRLDAVQHAAIEHGLISPQEAAALDDTETLDLIFRSGFSTAAQVTDLSGRGVGLDVVRQNLEQLHGLIQVKTDPGNGTTFVLTVPLSLTTTYVLLVQVCGVTAALPMTNVERILRVQVEKINSIEGKPVIYAEGRALPLIYLGEILELPQAAQPLSPGAYLPVVVVRAVDRRVAFRVDAFAGTQEVVVKSLGQQLRRVRNVAGASILGDGQVVMILNVADIMKSIHAHPGEPSLLKITTEMPRPRRLMVVDDSITTRTMEKHILENAGYRVQVAANGQEAWELLRHNESELPDLIVADVQMPEMDGFTLTEKIKAGAQTSNLPVVLVTSLETTQDRLRGLNAGADAYITKGAFDQRELLETIERLI